MWTILTVVCICWFKTNVFFIKISAPNSYRIPSVLDAPVYTISGRHKLPVDDRVKVPAPGTYSPEKVYKVIKT